MAKIFEREDAGAGELRQSLDACKEGEQRDIAKCDTVSRRGKRFENNAADAKTGAKMLFKLCSRVARDLHGRELPHAGKEDVVVRAGIFHQDRAAARIAKNRGGYFHVYSDAFDAGRRDFIGEAEFVCSAPLRDGAYFAARILRRANRLAQFH